jgi:hypothetical protein
MMKGSARTAPTSRTRTIPPNFNIRRMALLLSRGAPL